MKRNFRATVSLCSFVLVAVYVRNASLAFLALLGLEVSRVYLTTYLRSDPGTRDRSKGGSLDGCNALLTQGGCFFKKHAHVHVYVCGGRVASDPELNVGKPIYNGITQVSVSIWNPQSP